MNQNKKKYITINIPEDIHREITLLKIGFAYTDKKKYSVGQTLRRIIDDARVYDRDANEILGRR